MMTRVIVLASAILKSQFYWKVSTRDRLRNTVVQIYQVGAQGLRVPTYSINWSFPDYPTQ